MTIMNYDRQSPNQRILTPDECDAIIKRNRLDEDMVIREYYRNLGRISTFDIAEDTVQRVRGSADESEPILDKE